MKDLIVLIETIFAKVKAEMKNVTVTIIPVSQTQSAASAFSAASASPTGPASNQKNTPAVVVRLNTLQYEDATSEIATTTQSGTQANIDVSESWINTEK